MFHFLKNTRPVSLRVIPNPRNKFNVDLFVAAIGHVGTRVTPMEKEALQNTIKTTAAWDIEEYDRIARLHAHFASAAKIAVQYPSSPAISRRTVSTIRPWEFRSNLGAKRVCLNG
jgi:hypothetical protein